MDEIQDFLNNILAKYPETWSNIDDYIKNMMPYETKDPFTYKSKYYKEFIPVLNGKNLTFIPIYKANLKDIEKYKGFFSTRLIDFEELFKENEKNDFDIESWSNERNEGTLKQIIEFLFECNIFKGVFFFGKLSQLLAEITNSLDNLETMPILYSDKPNWLQIEIKEKLKLEIEALKNILIFNFDAIYPKLSNVLNRINTSNSSEKTPSFTWYKIAKIMAEGYLEIQDDGYYILNGVKEFNESKAARMVSEHLYGHPNDYDKITPFLNRTKSKIDDNKNIFRSSRVSALKSLAANAQHNNTLSGYFKMKLSELESQEGF